MSANRTTRGALLALLLLLPILPAAEAGVPAPPEWSPWTAPQTVTALALADNGATIAAGLGAYNAQSDCSPTQTGCTPVNAPTDLYDLAVLTLQDGVVARADDAAQEGTPQGRPHVAVSADGTTIASFGYSRSVGSPVSAPVLYYNRAANGNDWSVPGTNITRFVEGDAVGIAVSADGRRVALVLHNAGNMSIRGYSFQNGILSQAFDHVTPGRPHALAASADLSRLAVVGVVPVGGFNRSAVLTVPFSSGGVESPYYLPEGVNVTRVALSSDGQRVAAGGSNGTLLLFRGSAAFPPPETLDVGNATVGAVAFSGDGRRLAVGTDTLLRVFSAGDAGVQPAWDVALSSPPRAMDLNHTGGILLLGSREGVFAYNEEGGQMWKLNGDTSAVGVNADGSAIAYAQRRLVFAASVPRGLALTLPGGVETMPPKTIPPGGSGDYTLSVYNPGAAAERVVFTGPDDLDVAIDFQPADLLVNPGETRSVTATVRPGTSLQAGSRGFNVTAHAITSGLSDDTTLNFTIAPIADVSLFLNVTEVLAKQGETSDLLMEVRNQGTKAVALSLRADQEVTAGQPWNVTVDPTSFTLNPNSKTTVRVSVTPPRNAANGTSNTITYLLEGAEVSDRAVVTYRINPEIGIEVIPSARVKYIDAGQSDTFNITVKNTGSLPRRFEVYYDINETSGRSWGIDMPLEPFRLEPSGSRTVTIKVTVPVEARPPDYLKFTVTARLLPEGDEPVVQDSVPIFANAQEPERDEEEEEDNQNPLPAPGPAVVFGLVAALAFAIRRRRS